LSTPEYIPADYSYPMETLVPLFDEDGDLAQTNPSFDMRASANSWHEAGGVYTYPFQECVFSEQLDIMLLNIATQLFQYQYQIGWGELGGTASGGSDGTWIEPDSQLA